MKIALNKSIRDAQIRDSFNKESVVTMNDNEMYEYVKLLYIIQTETPRNVSKLHSLVVCGDNELYLLNFEVLRSVELPVENDGKKTKVQGFTANDRPIYDPKRKPVTKFSIEESGNTGNINDLQENDDVEHEEEGGKDDDNECSELEDSRK